MIIDTAGIHLTDDKVEQEGIKRAKQILAQADIILQVMDASRDIELQKQQLADLPYNRRKLTVYNKSDLCSQTLTLTDNEIMLSAKTGQFSEKNSKF